MFEYKDNKLVKSSILLAVILALGVCIGYLVGTLNLKETIIYMSDSCASKIILVKDENAEATAKIIASHRNSTSRMSSRNEKIMLRLEAMLDRMEKLESTGGHRP